MSQNIEMIVFDMAGTTVKDNNEVEKCFREAMEQTGLITTSEKINSMMGWSKITVFETLWKEQLPHSNELEIKKKVEDSFQIFRKILENHYLKMDVLPSDGCLEIFGFLKEMKIKIALTTGFYREVTDIILSRLGWDEGLDKSYSGSKLINASVSSDQVFAGRPSPFMVFRAMELCMVNDVRKIIKIGDTPSDLYEGKNAGCQFTIGITNGTHSKDQLQQYEHDFLTKDLFDFRHILNSLL